MMKSEIIMISNKVPKGLQLNVQNDVNKLLFMKVLCLNYSSVIVLLTLVLLNYTAGMR